jgi:predicted DNA-binding transcriptional regulator YafY
VNTLDRVARMREIYRRIQQESTGMPETFAQKYCISRSQLYNILDELKDYGADIRYSRKRQTFYCNNEFNIDNLFTK